MTTETQATGTEKTGNEDTTTVDTTATAPVETAVEQTEEEKQDAEKVEAAQKVKREEESTYKKINRTIKELKNESKTEKEARHQAELKAARLEGELEAIKRQGGKAGDRPETADPIEAAYAKQHPEPNIDQYETQEDYQKAVRAWDRGLVRFELEQSGKTSQETARQTEQRKAQETMAQTLKAQREKGESEYDDFEEVVGDLEFDHAALKVMAASEIGQTIAYYLGMNPAEKARIDKLSGSPELQAREVARIEVGIESGKIVVTKKPVRRVSTAPEPAPRPSGSARPAPKTIAEAKTSEERFAIWERENKK